MDSVLVVDQLAEAAPPRSLAEALREVPDPRGKRGKRHELAPILALAVCAMLCGARSLYAIAQWGRDHGPEDGDCPWVHTLQDTVRGDLASTVQAAEP